MQFDASTHLLLTRRTRGRMKAGRVGQWEWEVGSPPQSAIDPNSIVPSSKNPMCIRKDTKGAYQWRIRNLNTDMSTFSVFVDETTDEIVVKTSNRKYYKRIAVPDLQRLGKHLHPDCLTSDFANGCLIITYVKDSQVLDFEKQKWIQIMSMATKL
eukprot:GHVL01044820.1.p1 GENE.GHVL01044820.1~~GHVL01044820.1.p1  ORF type:complete len:155 (+),score=8.67 GHVL01044820.1:224-688(+)